MLMALRSEIMILLISLLGCQLHFDCIICVNIPGFFKTSISVVFVVGPGWSQLTLLGCEMQSLVCMVKQVLRELLNSMKLDIFVFEIVLFDGEWSWAVEKTCMLGCVMANLLKILGSKNSLQKI